MRLGEKRNIDTHDLVRTGDPEARVISPGTDQERWPAFCDRNGEVVLGYCRRCHGGEAELDEKSCLERLLDQALARHETLPPLEKAIAHLEQKRGWVTAEMRMNDDASPNGRTREEAHAILLRVAPEYVILDELKRLMAIEAERNAKEHVAADGTVRKSHYTLNARGEQVWDTTVRFGWGPIAAAFCVLRYLRRDKDEEHSLKSAKWYYERLKEFAKKNRFAEDIWEMLMNELTEEERSKVYP